MNFMWNDFKEFAFKGNIIDLAVAVVIGTAFGKIVSSLVENIITPFIGMISGGIDFSGMHKGKFTYGVFLQSVIDFFIVAIVIFLVIRMLSKFKKKEEVVEEVVEIDAQEALLIEIRDLLKEQNNR